MSARSSSTSPSPSPTPPFQVLILGAGLAGLSLALALSKFTSRSHPLKISIFELRPTPSTIGGAINLTPNALRYLDALGILAILRARQLSARVRSIEIISHASGKALGAIDFTNGGVGFGEPPGYTALRIGRSELVEVLAEAVRGELKEQGQVRYGHKVVKVDEVEEKVHVRFDNGETAVGDLVLGCDGIHSAVRRYVDPARTPSYSGIAAAYSFVKPSEACLRSLPWKDTCLISSAWGSFLASYYEPSRTSMYVGAVMEVKEVESREGWRAKGADKMQMKEDIKERFTGGKVRALHELMDCVDDWFLYPVYKIPPRGNWAKGRVMLLGDAAHAMPPQGESAGMALEDVVVFARLLAQHGEHSIGNIFAAYERTRRQRIDTAYDEASFRWETVKHTGWFAQWMKEGLMSWWIWWTAKSRNQSFHEDLTTIDLTV